MSSLIAPSLNTILFMKCFLKTNSHFKLQLLAACVIVTAVSQLINPLCQVAHSEVPHSKAPGRKVVLWWRLDGESGPKDSW